MLILAIHLNNAESKYIDRDCSRVLGMRVRVDEIGCKRECAWL